MTTLVAVLAVMVGLPGLAAATHLGVLTLGSLFYRERAGGAGEQIGRAHV